jgi:sensor histidine kinase YesM
MGAIAGKTLEESVEFSTEFRYIYLIVVETILVFILWLILRIRKKTITLSNPYDVFAFIAIPALCMIAMFTDVFIYQIVNFDSQILLLVIINLFVLIVISVLIWSLLLKVSKDNQVKTELLLSKQREEMYQNSVIASNGYIQKTSEIKHDIKNNILTISSLISDGECEKAQSLCNTITKELVGTAPAHTSNPVLNAILNVELEKAQSHGIMLTYEINEPLSFIKDADIVSIIGNLCDNAIEYLVTLPELFRKMSLSIASHKNFYYITCKNTIEGSVLAVNPKMNTSKEDHDLHGKGLAILNRLAKKYDGEVHFKEENNTLLISVFIRDQK